MKSMRTLLWKERKENAIKLHASHHDFYQMYMEFSILTTEMFNFICLLNGRKCSSAQCFLVCRSSFVCHLNVSLVYFFDGRSLLSDFHLFDLIWWWTSSLSSSSLMMMILLCVRFPSIKIDFIVSFVHYCMGMVESHTKCVFRPNQIDVSCVCVWRGKITIKYP